LGAAAGCAAGDADGEANELSEGLPAMVEPKGLDPWEPPREAKGDVPEDSLPNPDAAKALADVCG